MADISGKQCISTEGGKNGQGKKKNCSKLTDDISVHCSLLDAAAVLASTGLVPPCICFLKRHMILRGGGEEQEGKCLRIFDSYLTVLRLRTVFKQSWIVSGCIFFLCYNY